VARATPTSGQNESGPPHRRSCSSALTIAEACLGPDDPSVAVALANLAAVRREQGAVGQARELLERALHLLLESHGDHDATIRRVRGALRGLAHETHA
jgi:Tfp pilus assembly protein PilF